MHKLTSSIFITYLLIGIYVLVVAIRAPFINISVDTSNELPVIIDPYYTSWAQQQNIERGDIILSIDQQSAKGFKSFQQDTYIPSANELSILKLDGTVHTIKVLHRELPEEFYTHIVFPMFYFMLCFGVAFYLWQHNKDNFITKLLMLFLLTCSLAYTSTGASSRGNGIGMIVNGICIVLCLVLIIHFLQQYFRYLHIKWSYFDTKWLYFIPLVIIPSCYVIELFVPHFSNITPNITLSLFALLILYATFILLTSYLRTRLAKIRLIAISCIIPFLPFLLLFVVPEILGNNTIIQPEISVLFILFIPFSFIFIQLNERLFDIEYQLSRFRYYSSLAFFSSLIITTVLAILLFSQLTIAMLIVVFFVLFVGFITSFYIKEQLDFKHRKIIFSSSGDYVHNLYAAVNRIGNAKNQQELLNKLKSEITEKLGTTAFTLETITEDVQFPQGGIQIENQMTQLLIHDTVDEKILIRIRHTLQKEELLWLELLALYVSMFIDNLKHIEDLVRDIQHMKDTNNTQLPWLDKLLWNIIEKEKSILAQELHDTILQEQLHLARELDVIASSPIIEEKKVLNIREQLINATKDLREYCENLSPPLLDTFGLEMALKKLVQKVKIRANFLLNTQIDRVQFQDATLHLVVYRLVQELLNNAIKHADASKVSLKLFAINNGFVLQYDDNGIGCNIEDLMQSSASMGINGIRERVRAFNGEMTITSKPNDGMHVFIQIQEECEEP
ncbi:sensor histidine kinase [Lysinibacillus sp. CD3-6]|uniref:sensor histidine kinase n=1 Tax=Lysinibacillus sp. CD3-6 TaxID=2892541 RepID=UPI001175B785|nr:ATP-binding protein [Lysinibacillus sp. CD3-6]UED78313.1 sensor histidine kinase [Lysinibacillus sp. CD3-6]